MEQQSLRRYIYLSIAAAAVTILLKFHASTLTGSMGLFSDALESLVNLFAAIFALIMFNISRKPADREHEFGHSKAEYFSSAAEGALILIAAFSIIRTTIPRLITPHPIENIGTGLCYSLLATLVNLAAGLTLIRRGKKAKSLLLEADGRHLMTDVWTSAGVILSIIIVKLTGWLLVDPLIALIVALNIIRTGYGLISRSASGLMDATLPGEDLIKITTYLDSLKSQQIEYHSLLTRAAGHRKFITLHVLVPGQWTVKQAHDHADRIEETLVNMFDERVTVHTHLEPVEDPASMRDIGIDREQMC
ncbi:MAG: cation diffusion facilitator family transporter [Proteiniphilum sp.]|jgi:cation diffusion facilitator family transporter|nr:cation diffusion facilitator family transporter [Proteiniphilum sp.]